MSNEDPCINEKKGLLQDCLPGVTLNNNNVYYHQHPPYSHSHHPHAHAHEIDQLQQHILISNSLNKRNHKLNNYSMNNTTLTSASSKGDLNNTSSMDEQSSIHILWLDKDNYDDDDDEFDDMASSSFSIRQAAAVSEGKRRSEERWLFYLKISLVLMFFLMLCDQFQPTTTTTTTTTPTTSSHKKKKHGNFRFHKHWNKNVNSMFATQQQDGRDDNERRQILVALKDLDEAIHGDIILRSNKTKFLNAARVWQRQDFAFEEPSSPSSPSSPSLSSQQKMPPFAVIEATTVEDVQLAVPILAGLARDYRLDFRVRSGGHAYMTGYSTVSNGVTLNLAKLNSITNTFNVQNHKFGDSEVGDHVMNLSKTIAKNNETATTSSTSIKTVVIGPGVRTEDFMKDVLDAHGYSGIVASAAGVGMGGFVLGGGYGLQSRMYGLAIDNVVSLQVVLDSGEIKDVKEGDDLFWALRGSGGGNIGVVTSMEYQVYPSHDIKLAATVKVRLAEMTRFLQRLGDLEPDVAPEFTLTVQGYKSHNNHTIPGLFQHVTTTIFEKNSDRDKKEETENEEDGLVTISMFWMGDSNPEDPVGMQYIKKEIIPLFSNNSTMDNVVYYYFSWSGMSREREQNPGLKSVWSAQSWNGFLLPNNNTQEVWTDIQSSLSAMFRYCKYISPKVELWGGAISKIPSNATAFPHRNAVYNIGIDLLVPTESDADAANDEMHLVNAIWPSIERHLDGVYVNYPMASLSNESYPSAYWGTNLNRLMELKERYDPSHTLNVAQSIPIRINDTTSPAQL